MQDKELKSLKTQAGSLGRHLRAQYDVQLTHSQLLEALAAMHNAPTWNALAARPGKPNSGPHSTAEAVASMNAETLLRAAIAKGLTAGEALNVFAEKHTGVEHGYISAAKSYVSEGSLEVDDNAIVSSSDDGAYVQAWVWVESSELELTALAQLEGFELHLLSAQGLTGAEAATSGWVLKEGDSLVLALYDADVNEVRRLALPSSCAFRVYEPDEDDDEAEERLGLDSDDPRVVDYVELMCADWQLRLRVDAPQQ